MQGTYECKKICSDKRATDPSKWIITENHHEAIVTREIFDKVQERFSKKLKPWKRNDKHIMVGRVVCGCCGRNLRHNVSGHHYYWCSGLNIYQIDGCVKRVEDFYLEEVVLFQLQQHILELGESDRLLQEEKSRGAEVVEGLKQECKVAERAVENAKKKRMADFEAYALGKKESYDSSRDQLELLRKKYEELRERLSLAEDKVREYSRVKVHEGFAVKKLTPELMDEYIESIEIHPGNDIRVIWK